MFSKSVFLLILLNNWIECNQLQELSQYEVDYLNGLMKTVQNSPYYYNRAFYKTFACVNNEHHTKLDTILPMLFDDGKRCMKWEDSEYTEIKVEKTDNTKDIIYIPDNVMPGELIYTVSATSPYSAPILYFVRRSYRELLKDSHQPFIFQMDMYKTVDNHWIGNIRLNQKLNYAIKDNYEYVLFAFDGFSLIKKELIINVLKTESSIENSDTSTIINNMQTNNEISMMEPLQNANIESNTETIELSPEVESKIVETLYDKLSLFIIDSFILAFESSKDEATNDQYSKGLFQYEMVDSMVDFENNTHAEFSSLVSKHTDHNLWEIDRKVNSAILSKSNFSLAFILISISIKIFHFFY